jgi:hypothetical protein
MINDIFNLANVIFERENQPELGATPVDKKGSSLFGVGRNVLCGQLQIELSGEQVDHRLEVSD